MATVLSVFAQIPQTMSYQAVVRDGDNALVISKAVSIELSILRGSDEGTVVYAEKHDATTNANGLISLELGNGEQISETAFSQIDWSAGPYFVKTVAEFDGKTVTGVTPMLTVPYAKFAEKAGNIPDLTDYAKKSDIPESANLEGYVKSEVLNDYAKSADVDNTYVKKAEMPATLEDYAKKSDIPESANLENYVKTEDLADYALKSEIPTEANLDGYVKTEELNDYAKTADVEQTYAKKDELPTEVDLSDYAKKSDLDGFATTAKMNDTLNVYAKSTDVSGNYVTKEEFENYVLSGGQADAIDLSVYAKSADVNAALAELEGKIPAEQDLTNYATKEELNALNIPSVEGLASETYVNEQVAAIQIPSVPTKVSDLENDANYITLNDVPATDLTDYAKSADVSATYVTKEEFEDYVLSGGQADAIDLSVYAKSADVNAALAELEGKIPAAQDLSGYATKEELNALNIPSVEGLASETYVNEQVAAIQIPTVPTKVSDFENDANYITLSDVPATDLSAYATKEELNALNIPSVEGLASETYVNEQVAAIQIPTVPTKVSDFENDANYITLSDVPATDLTGYATTAKMNDTLKAYVLKSEIGTPSLDGYYSKDEVDALLAEMNERFAALSEFVEASKNPKLSKPTIYKNETTYITLYAKITSAGFGDIIERGFVCSRTPNPTVTDNEQKDVSSGTSVDENYYGTFDYLASGYTYYIRAYATSSTGTGYSESITVTTTLRAPEINSGSYSDVTAESFVMHSSVKFEAQITQWGFCYSTTNESPTTSDDKVTVDVAGTDFEATITGLTPGKTYYVRPFAKNSMGTTYGSTYTVTTQAVPPTVEGLSTTEVAGKSFKVTAEIAFNGGAHITAKGFCYSMSENPTIEDSKVTGEQAEGDNFIAEITGLSPVTTYYVRAYATNSAGTSYSEQITVTTTAVLATVAEVTSSDITGVSFKVASEITDNGGAEVTEKGFCYSTTENPTIDDTKIAVDGNDFETTIEELANGTTYYVRAYAMNSVGTAYSDQISVLTLAPAILADVTSDEITGVSFKVTSSITANGGAEVTEKGFCYSTTENPTIEDSKQTVDGDDFEVTIEELANGTTYYVRAYAMNSVGTAYSDQISVLTLTLATVADVTCSDITGVSFKVSSSITANGGAEVTEKGFCYSTTENPTIEDYKKAVDSDEFATTITGRTNGMTYYVRAYAVNSVGTAYSEQISIHTLAPATVADVTSSDITGVSFKVSSEITADGGAEVTEKGFCYSTNKNPTVANTKKVVDSDEFEVTIDELANGTTYYVRAYAVNSVGTSYSAQETVKTLTLATVSNITSSSITATSFVVSSEIIDNGGIEVSEKGFCYSTTENPTVDDNNYVVEGSGFSATIENLSPGTTYYVRAYAVNSVGIRYSTQKIVTTSAVLATVTTATSSEITGGSFKASSEITDNGGATITEKGFCYSTTKQNPTTSDNYVIVSGDDFEATIENLLPITTYYVRAYARNSAGTAYSEPITVTTLNGPAVISIVTSYEITETEFKVFSAITSNGGAEVTEKGFCYSTSENPTTADTKLVVEGDDFETTIQGLVAGETYYVRAYAVNSEGTGYSNQKTLKSTPVGGIKNAVFSVTATKQVQFSQGNFQYNAVQGTHDCADGTTKQGTWRFAENQYDVIGADNANISSTYDGWIDLFGFGTSGYSSNTQPYSSSTSQYDYPYYSLTSGDWGVYNAISNGGNQAGLWRGLTVTELSYLFSQRSDANNKHGIATLNGILGIVLLPDYWTQPEGVSFIPAPSTYENGSLYEKLSINTYSYSDWSEMEANGAVFLPAAGHRGGKNVVYNNTFVAYATRSCSGTYGKWPHQYILYYSHPEVGYSPNYYFYIDNTKYQTVDGLPIRLVQDVE